jgi:hypothetical protein
MHQQKQSSQLTGCIVIIQGGRVMKRISIAVAIIGFLSALVSLFATDYGFVQQNLSSWFRNLEQSLRPYWAIVAEYWLFAMLLGTFVCAFVLLAVFARGLPTMVKEVLVGQPLGNVNVFVHRDDHQYKKYFNRYFRKASTVDIIGIGNSQFSEQDWGRAVDYAVGQNHTLVRVLFLDPHGTQIRAREIEEKLDPGWLSSQVRTHTRHLQEIIEHATKRYPYAAGLVKYKFYDSYPSSNLVLLDRKHAFLQPYFFSLRGRANPIFFLSEAQTEEITRISREFDRLWEGARTAEDVLTRIDTGSLARVG